MQLKNLKSAILKNTQLKIISERVTGNTELLLKFMNEYELDSTSTLSDLKELDGSMLEYCNNNNIDNIVYGKPTSAVIILL